jgi:hypothetical protein
VLLHALSDSRHPCVPRLIGPNGERVTPVEDPERSVSERGLVRRVGHKLCPREPLHPLFGPVTCEPLKVHDDDPISCLGLPIRLRVEGGCHVQLGAHQAHELTPESRREDRIPVRHDGPWHPM